MTDVLQNGAAWLSGVRKSHAAHQVAISRSGFADVTVEATVGETIFRITDAYGLETRTVSRDYIVTAADYIFGGVVVEPQSGDTVTEVTEGTTRVYEILSPGDEPNWRYSGVAYGDLRLHTKLIDTQTT